MDEYAEVMCACPLPWRSVALRYSVGLLMARYRSRAIITVRKVDACSSIG